MIRNIYCGCVVAIYRDMCYNLNNKLGFWEVFFTMVVLVHHVVFVPSRIVRRRKKVKFVLCHVAAKQEKPEFSDLGKHKD